MHFGLCLRRNLSEVRTVLSAHTLSRTVFLMSMTTENSKKELSSLYTCPLSPLGWYNKQSMVWTERPIWHPQNDRGLFYLRDFSICDNRALFCRLFCCALVCTISLAEDLGSRLLRRVNTLLIAVNQGLREVVFQKTYGKSST